jgi:muramoyltetrapeptide carboxypeptidase LdcA involved in peptidoglycan recycling
MAAWSQYEWCGNRGNIRCFLKLAGTEFLPDPSGKIIFLESLGGRVNRIASLVAQIQQIGCFNVCSGLILGSFTELEHHNELPILEEYIKEVTKQSNIPIVKTDELGHGDNCKGIMIGKRIDL